MHELPIVLRLYKEKFNLSTRELAGELSVSSPTIERWLVEKNLPHPLVEFKLVEHMREKLQK